MTAQHEPVGMLAAALAVGCAVKNGASGARTNPGSSAPRVPPPTADAVRHVLGRFTFGPRPGDAEQVGKLGIEGWFEAQLVAEPHRPSPAYASALAGAEAVIAAFGAQSEGDPADTEQISLRKQARRVNATELLGAMGAAQIERQVESEAQLHALMVDFWVNHFNIFARKNALKVLAGNYVETAIVPHALGRFEDLLLATARHPAMLIYLDNDKSVAHRARGRRGLNENYARELLELHTLGVNGGYTQDDVIGVARILTGWGVGDPSEQSLDFEFRPERHDTGAKSVLGLKFPAGEGEAEGLALLRFLAQHGATARHLAQKLCQRFIADDPPASCVSDVAATFLGTRGDIGAVLREILRQPAFWAAEQRAAKLKKPSEFLASALRALGLKLDGSAGIMKASQRLGEPPLLYQAPTGYPDRVSAWAGGSQILARMDLAARLVSGQIDGVDMGSLAQLLPATDSSEVLIGRINQLIFGGLGDARTLAILRDEVSLASNAEEQQSTALALALGSPAFQRR